ncbi:hypothetical protein CRG98_010377, partial [Punica granatum]
MMSRCSIVRSPNEIQLFHSLNGIQRLAETRRFKHVRVNLVTVLIKVLLRRRGSWSNSEFSMMGSSPILVQLPH